ncbi:MAG: family metallopeptidase [Clostridia bacterium]|jgi:predicted metal-dependent hydrolase|nr:family metallopeptidase [Clostridia bacterium]
MKQVNKAMYHILKQKRKTVSIYVEEDLSVVVKVPQHLSKKHIDEILASHKQQIEKMIAKKESAKQKSDWRVTNSILYLGQDREIEWVSAGSGRAQIKLTDHKLMIALSDQGNLEEAEILIQTFFKEQAKTLFTRLTEKYTSLLGLKYSKISIRKQKTRWGSCSAKGNLSYNVRLLCAEEKMIEYIVLHEVMHLRHFNHGKVFWEDIEKLMPDYKQRAQYFKHFGQDFIL